VLILSNDDVRQVLTIEATIEALRESYADVADGIGVCRPRIDFRMPTRDTSHFYLWSTMDGASTRTGYLASRMVSDLRYSERYGGVETSEEYCIRPGLFFGIVMLFRMENAEPLAIIQDSWLQRLRVAGDAAIGVEVMANPDAARLGMLGSGGQARAYLRAIRAVRPIEQVKVYSPTRANRERYAAEMAGELGIRVTACDTPAEVYHDADILASCTDGGFAENPNPASAHLGRHLEPGTHVVSLSGPLDQPTIDRIDRSLVLGMAPAPVGVPDAAGEFILAYAPPEDHPAFREHEYWHRRYHSALGKDNGYPIRERTVYLPQILAGEQPARTTREQVTFSERGNLQGAQFHAVAGRIYEAALERGLGREIPTDWLVEDERN
jgi:ornithine cyclodeaminase/alanine dehydrogenase-like protein (mu-crystallin family)